MLEMAKAKRPACRGTSAVLPDTAEGVCDTPKSAKTEVTAGGPTPRAPPVMTPTAAVTKNFMTLCNVILRARRIHKRRMHAMLLGY